jgi:membrane associated rhomboid family serine protease
VGASGAVFGLMAAAFVMQRHRGIDPMASGLGPVILLNLGITFLLPGISIGGHLGGLIGGAAAAFALENLSARRSSQWVALLACLGLSVLAVAGSLAVANAQSGF